MNFLKTHWHGFRGVINTEKCLWVMKMSDIDYEINMFNLVQYLKKDPMVLNDTFDRKIVKIKTGSESRLFRISYS